MVCFAIQIGGECAPEIRQRQCLEKLKFCKLKAEIKSGRRKLIRSPRHPPSLGYGAASLGCYQASRLCALALEFSGGAAVSAGFGDQAKSKSCGVNGWKSAALMVASFAPQRIATGVSAALAVATLTSQAWFAMPHPRGSCPLYDRVFQRWLCPKWSPDCPSSQWNPSAARLIWLRENPAE